MLRYRREDAAAYAGRLYDRLAAEFGRDNVFMDIDTIRPADHFGDITEQTLASAPLVLVIMGPRLLLVATLFKAQLGAFLDEDMVVRRRQASRRDAKRTDQAPPGSGRFCAGTRSCRC